jgi:hypothetical protein
MTVTRADRKAGARIKFRRGVEVADGMYDMVEAVGHAAGPEP